MNFTYSVAMEYILASEGKGWRQITNHIRSYYLNEDDSFDFDEYLVDTSTDPAEETVVLL